MRLLALEGGAGDARVRNNVEETAHSILPRGDSSRFNQALMDFGSMVCRPRVPQCEQCFATSLCKAYALGLQKNIPDGKRKQTKEIAVAVAVFKTEDAVYLQQRPPDGLFAGMWEFPGGKLEADENAAEAVVREVKEELDAVCLVEEDVTSFVHFYTRFKVNLHSFICSTSQDLPHDDRHRWVEWEDVGEYPMPSATRRVIDILISNEQKEQR